MKPFGETDLKQASPGLRRGCLFVAILYGLLGALFAAWRFGLITLTK